MELAHTYGSDAFLTCYSKFVALMGTTSAVYSDRATRTTRHQTTSLMTPLPAGTGGLTRRSLPDMDQPGTSVLQAVSVEMASVNQE